MRIAILAINDYEHDPRARVLTHQLTTAGHDVRVIRLGESDTAEGVVSRNQPAGSGLVSRVVRRRMSVEARDRRRSAALVAAVVASGADLIHPTTEAAVTVAVIAARQLGVPVARLPQWAGVGPHDLILRTPAEPQLSRPISPGLPFHTPQHHPDATQPPPGRHAGIRLALAYRKTDSNPGKYLEAAMRSAGIDVDLHTEHINFDNLHPDTDGVVFVEGPYPAITVTGQTPHVPIAFWVHHGEHHLGANLRLAERYRADLVLLAHSWHLAHFFRQPVQRFPFGMADDLFDASTPIAQRQFDVAMVGAYIRGGGPYTFRGDLTTSLESALGSTAFEENVSAERMAELYQQARIIPNEGGTRHFPITMRVLEAIGAGALLITQPIPGLDQILTRDVHYLELADDFVGQITDVLSDYNGIQTIVDAATHHVANHHLYAHRIDELLAGLKQTPKIEPSPTNDMGAFASWIDADVEVQRLLAAEGTSVTLPGRELWHDVSEPLPASYEAVVFRGETPPPAILAAARRYIYAETQNVRTIQAFVAEHHPAAEISQHDAFVRVDLKAPSYRVT